MIFRETLLAEIEAFLTQHNMAASTFGRLAVGDTAFVHRLREGADVYMSTVERLVKFMSQYAEPPRKRGKVESRAAA